MKTLKEVLKKFGCEIEDEPEMNDEDFELLSGNSSFKNDLLNSKGEQNLDSQYKSYMNHLK